MKGHRTLRQIFAAPIVVGALSIVGLLAALIGDGWWDVLSWLTLTIPVLLYAFFLVRQKRARQAENL